MAEHLGIPHMTFYHVGAFGVLGIEDSLAYPEFLEGTNLAQQSLSTRIFKVGPVAWLAHGVDSGPGKAEGLRWKELGTQNLKQLGLPLVVTACQTTLLHFQTWLCF